VLRERPGIGPAYLFPSPKTPGEPMTKDLAREWLLEAERLVELPKLAGGAWDPYRRKWATARKHLPLKDVAAAGAGSAPRRCSAATSSRTRTLLLATCSAAPSYGSGRREVGSRSWPSVLAHPPQIAGAGSG